MLRPSREVEVASGASIAAQERPVILLAFWNILLPTEVIEDGKFTLTRLAQSANVEYSILLTPAGMVIDRRSEFWNTPP